MLKNINFWYLFSAQTISSFGSYFGMLAIEWLAYEMTGSLLVMGSILMAMGIAQLVIGFFGAPLIDRVDRYQLMAVLDWVCFIAMAAPAILAYTNTLEIWHLFVSIILIGACTALFKPAGMAVLPSIVKKEQLVRANSILNISISSAVVIGPGMAGATIHFLGASHSLVFDAISYLLSGILIIFLRRSLRKFKPNGMAVKRTTTKLNTPLLAVIKVYANELFDGLRFFKVAPYLFLIMCMVSLRNMSALAVAAVTLPYGLEILKVDAFGVGLLGSASAIGILVGSSLLVIIGDVNNRRLPMLGSVFLGGMLYCGLALTTNFIAALIIFFFLGATGPLFSSFSSSIYGQVVPEEYRGRVMSARLLVGGSLQPVGSYIGGALSHAFGIPFLFLAVGVLPAVAGFTSYFLPAAKKIDGELKEVHLLKPAGEGSSAS